MLHARLLSTSAASSESSLKGTLKIQTPASNFKAQVVYHAKMEAGDEVLHQPLLNPGNAQPQSSRSSNVWTTSLRPLGTYCCCHVAYQGVFTSLVLYLKRVWSEDNATAAATVSAVSASGFCTCFIVAFLSDSYLGRLWTSALNLFVFFLGCCFLSIIAQLQLKAEVFFTISLYLCGVGYGWFMPSLATLGGDQFVVPKDRNTFYSCLFVAGTIGEIFSLTIVIYIENLGHWACGYWICTGAIGAGILCLVGMRGVKFEIRENPFERILHVLVAATWKCKVDVPADSNTLFEPNKGSGRLLHTDKFRFLDKAATISTEDVVGVNVGSPWRLCSVQKVEEVKSLLNVLPLWAVVFCKATAMSQFSNLFVEQGDAMNIMLGSFEVAPASMTLFNMLARIVIAMAFGLHTRRTTASKRPASIALFQIGIAYVTAMLSMLVAALVETVRLSKARAGVELSILWLGPQYAFEGVAIVCGTVGEADFFYSAVAPGVRSLGSSFPVLSRGLGGYISSLLVNVVTLITTANGQAGWIASDLNDGHLNYFFLLLAGFIFLSSIMFFCLANRFSGYAIDEEKEVTSFGLSD